MVKFDNDKRNRYLPGWSFVRLFIPTLKKKKKKSDGDIENASIRPSRCLLLNYRAELNHLLPDFPS